MHIRQSISWFRPEVQEIEALTKLFNSLWDDNANADAVVSATALPVPSYRRAKNQEKMSDPSITMSDILDFVC